MMKLRPKTIEALQPKLMDMSGPHSFGVSLTFDHEIFQSPKAPYHSSVCIEDPSHTHITLPPLELHNPIAHALDESYIASTCSRRKLSFLLSFSCMSQSRVCLCFKFPRSVAQHHDKSTDCLSCTCTHLCPVGTWKHELWLSSLLYISFLLVHTTWAYQCISGYMGSITSREQVHAPLV